MMHLWSWLFAVGFAVSVPGADPVFVPSTLTPPPVAREFRGVWVASVKNIDWPSRPGLPVEQQKLELTTLLDRAARIHLNAVILQVRPACDALYASPLEPWSEYLTGTMGQAPRPRYDPLEFAVRQAHQRGLELHAWFNPFRARHESAIAPASRGHITRTHPELVRVYGKQRWLDPGEPLVVDYATRVILDVVHRYDIDGIHLDDYFYPYPIKDGSGKWVDFPDFASWRKYVAGGGKLARADWRRANVDQFVRRLGAAIHIEKPQVKFGISPFGMWRDGVPAGIKGLDAYASLYADSRKWFDHGWVDYLSPQLYWKIDAPQQSYSALLKWWSEQNEHGRHLWPGNNLSAIGANWSVEESVNQVRLTRQRAGAGGNVFWSARALLQNRAGVTDRFASDLFREPALIPASPWLFQGTPRVPEISVAANPSGNVAASWRAFPGTNAWLWIVQAKIGRDWRTEILPGSTLARSFESGSRLEVIAVTGVDRAGNAGPSAVCERRILAAEGSGR